MKLKKLEVNKIKVPERARKDYKDIPSLASNMRTKGQMVPIIVNEDYILSAGGRRLAAAKLLGWSHIDAVIQPGKDELSRVETELIENFIREDFSWHERASLIASIHNMYKAKDSKWGIRATAEALGVSKSTVSNQLTLAAYLVAIPDLKDSQTEADAQRRISAMQEDLILQEIQKRKAEKEAKRQAFKQDTKDLIRRAGNFISDLCKEQTEEEDSKMGIEYLIGDFFEESKNWSEGYLGDNCLIECDPPYGIDLKTVKKNADIEVYNEVAIEEYPNFLNALISRLYKSLGNDSLVIFWFAIQWYQEILTCARSVGFKVNHIPAIWVKSATGLQNNQPSINLANKYDPFLLFRKGDVLIGSPGASNTFIVDAVPPQEKIHPTERPEALIKEIFQTVCQIQLIKKCFVPFLGSGNTLRVCKALNIPAFGYDLSESYYNKYATKDALKYKEKQ